MFPLKARVFFCCYFPGAPFVTQKSALSPNVLQNQGSSPFGPLRAFFYKPGRPVLQDDRLLTGASRNRSRKRAQISVSMARLPPDEKRRFDQAFFRGARVFLWGSSRNRQFERCFSYQKKGTLGASVLKGKPKENRSHLYQGMFTHGINQATRRNMVEALRGCLRPPTFQRRTRLEGSSAFEHCLLEYRPLVSGFIHVYTSFIYIM